MSSVPIHFKSVGSHSWRSFIQRLAVHVTYGIDECRKAKETALLTRQDSITVADSLVDYRSGIAETAPQLLAPTVPPDEDALTALTHALMASFTAQSRGVELQTLELENYQQTNQQALDRSTALTKIAIDKQNHVLELEQQCIDLKASLATFQGIMTPINYVLMGLGIVSAIASAVATLLTDGAAAPALAESIELTNMAAAGTVGTTAASAAATAAETAAAEAITTAVAESAAETGATIAAEEASATAAESSVSMAASEGTGAASAKLSELMNRAVSQQVSSIFSASLPQIGKSLVTYVCELVLTTIFAAPDFYEGKVRIDISNCLRKIAIQQKGDETSQDPDLKNGVAQIMGTMSQIRGITRYCQMVTQRQSDLTNTLCQGLTHTMALSSSAFQAYRQGALAAAHAI